MKTKQFPRPGIEIHLADKGGKDGKPDIRNIQLAAVGEYYHMYYGGFALTTEIFQAFISAYEQRIVDIDMMIDYDHERRDAAGWVKKLYLSENGEELWAEVDWTPPGAAEVEQKVFRYISIDCNFNHVDNESQLEHGPVLYGAALTNRPFIKGMAPVTELNELPGGNTMTLKELQDQNVKLAEDLKTAKSEKDAAVLALNNEKNALTEKVKALETEVGAEKAKVALAEKESAFAILLSEGKAVPAQKEAFIAGDMSKFASLAGAVKLNTQGNGGTDPVKEEVVPVVDADKDAKILKLAEEKFKAGGFKCLGDALSVAMKEVN